MFEILLEIFANRIGVFILGIAFIAGGIYGWIDYRQEINLYNAAISKEGKTADAEVVWKATERSNSDSYREDGNSTVVGYIKVRFEAENGEQDVKIYLDSDEYEQVKEGDILKIKYHPENPEYVVAPQSDRPSVILSTIGFGFCVFLGFLICLAVIISLF